MLKVRLFHLFLLLVVLSGCSQAGGQPTPTALVSATPGQPSLRTTSVPDARQAAQAYLDAWKQDDYGTMYSLLTSVSKDAV